jgi:uncharacterized cupredoxin-like copper-binding protein
MPLPDKKLVALALVVVLGACGAPGSATSNPEAARVTPSPSAACVGGQPTKGSVGATEQSYEIALSKGGIPAGKTTFQVVNVATVPHTFIVLRTDLPSDQLPLTANNTVDLESPDITVVKDVEGVQPCAPQEVSVSLKPGSYVAICNLPGHYASGMQAAFTVK